MQKLIQSIFLSLLFSGIISCTPPRAVMHSGKVTPHKQLRVGGDYSANLTSHFARSLYENIDAIATPLINKDTLILNEQILQLHKTAMAYAVDPFGTGYGIYARYGLLKGVDIGYKYASGVHVFDGMYQFLGSKGNFRQPERGIFNGSIGLQYSFKKYTLPSWSGLDKVQDILELEFKRKDLLIPLVFSVSFGEEETYGSFSWGLVYSHTFLNYGFDNNRIYDTINSVTKNDIGFLKEQRNYQSYGVFLNLKIGYKFIYLIPACALYYQNYGKYKLIDNSQVGFKGVSIVPSVGIQLNLSEIRHIYIKSKQRSSV